MPKGEGYGIASKHSKFHANYEREGSKAGSQKATTRNTGISCGGLDIQKQNSRQDTQFGNVADTRVNHGQRVGPLLCHKEKMCSTKLETGKSSHDLCRKGNASGLWELRDQPKDRWLKSTP
ncbi:hypothetical protein VNO78_03876 [Psophocarpus tetragonolobus]|uniref:Uncharacterized protein n=1 Tax=Psophocarpus tetragonolobus TaxID=3891 RepID=A0AAN9T535_PSOTE